VKNIHLSFCKNIRLRYLNREKEDETKKRGYETYECLYMNLKLSNSPFSIIHNLEESPLAPQSGLSFIFVNTSPCNIQSLPKVAN